MGDDVNPSLIYSPKRGQCGEGVCFYNRREVSARGDSYRHPYIRCSLVPLGEVCYAQLHRWHAVCPQYYALNGVALELRKVWLKHVVRVLSVA